MIRRWLSRFGRCDACNRFRLTQYSWEHGAHFCRRHWRENNR